MRVWCREGDKWRKNHMRVRRDYEGRRCIGVVRGGDREERFGELDDGKE
jgi:hypothetical protein